MRGYAGMCGGSGGIVSEGGDKIWMDKKGYDRIGYKGVVREEEWEEQEIWDQSTTITKPSE